MIYNENIVSEYGTFVGLSTSTPTVYRKSPTSSDYATGYFTRWFVKKINEPILFEVENGQSANANVALYTPVSLVWQISGPRDPIYSGKVLDRQGVGQQNLYSISTALAETGVDLSGILTNPLEFWRGN